MRHVALTTPTQGTVGRLEVSASLVATFSSLYINGCVHCRLLLTTISSISGRHDQQCTELHVWEKGVVSAHPHDDDVVLLYNILVIIIRRRTLLMRCVWSRPTIRTENSKLT